MIRDARAYEIERQQFELTMKQADHTFEELFAPQPARLSSSAAAVLKLRTGQIAIYSNREQLVSQWSQYQASRIRLLRFLGEFPFPDWPAFEHSLNPKPAAAADKRNPR